MKNQHGYISVILIIFLILLAFFLYPKVTVNNGEKVGAMKFCDTISDPVAEGYLDAPTYFSNSSYQVDGEGNQGGFIDSIITGSPTKYKMIKANVPIRNIAEDWFHFLGGDTVTTKRGQRQILWPTAISGAYTVKLPDNKGEPNVVFHDYGIIFLQHTGDNSVLKVGAEEYPVTDVYKDVNKPEIPYDDLFECVAISDDPNAIKNATFNRVVIPFQKESLTAKQLQLEWLLFEREPPKAALMSSGCKPAIYLYPPKKQLVNVRVIPKGQLTYTDPLYNKEEGWRVIASPNGLLENIGINRDSRGKLNRPQGIFDYLYYESHIPDSLIEVPKEGWVIKSYGLGVESYEKTAWFNPMEAKFKSLLPQLGLNAVQTNDFITYWKKALPYSPYYFVGILDQANTDLIEPLEITPKPDSINRVRIYFERLDSPKEVFAPSLNDQRFTINADAFNVVEWGGVVKRDPNQPFFCSE